VTGIVVESDVFGSDVVPTVVETATIAGETVFSADGGSAVRTSLGGGATSFDGPQTRESNTAPKTGTSKSFDLLGSGCREADRSTMLSLQNSGLRERSEVNSQRHLDRQFGPFGSHGVYAQASDSTQPSRRAESVQEATDARVVGRGVELNFENSVSPFVDGLARVIALNPQLARTGQLGDLGEELRLARRLGDAGDDTCKRRFKVGQLLFDFGMSLSNFIAACQQSAPFNKLNGQLLVLPMRRTNHPRARRAGNRGRDRQASGVETEIDVSERC